jgi:hypothetical protein
MRKLLLVGLIPLLLFTASCRFRGGSSSSSTTGTTSPTPVATVAGALAVSFRTAATGISLAFDGDPTKTEVVAGGEDVTRKFKPTVLCLPEGTGAVDGELTDRGTDGVFTFDIFFGDCAGHLDGNVGVSVTFERLTDRVVIAWSFFKGNLDREGCDIEPDGVEFDSTISAQGPVNVVTGGLTADCSNDDGEAAVTCSWSGVNPADETALAAGCTCAGAGC